MENSNEPIKLSLREQIKQARGKGIDIIVVGSGIAGAEVSRFIPDKDMPLLIVNRDHLTVDDQKELDELKKIHDAQFDRLPIVLKALPPMMYQPEIRIADATKPWYNDLGKKRKKKR